MTENEAQVERELTKLRTLLVGDVEVPVGMVARLQAAVRRESRVWEAVGWQVRLAIACLFYTMLGLWSSDTMTIPLAILFGVIAILYPWAANGRQNEAARAPDAHRRPPAAA